MIQDFDLENSNEVHKVYTVVQWPDVQDLMDIEGFDENSELILDEDEMEIYGSSAYYVLSSWMFENDLT